METGLYAYVMGCFETANLTYQEVADGSGISRRTVEKIARKEIKDPGVSHVEALARFFRSRELKVA